MHKKFLSESLLRNPNSLSWGELRQSVSDNIGFVIDYLEYISRIHSDVKLRKNISKLRKFEKKIASSTGPFLSYQETLEYQNMIFPIIIEWNPDIEKQVAMFYNAMVEIARLTSKSKKLQRSFNPYKLIQQNYERFYLAKEVVDMILQTVDFKKLKDIQVFAMFYSAIVITEVIDHYLFEQFKKSLKLFDLEKKYDIYDMFSVQSKYKNKKGQFQTDTRLIRNTLSHFNFTIPKNKEQASPILKLEIEDKPIYLNDKDFIRFYLNSVFLFQSFLSILYWMSSFATLRAHFVKPKICTKCKKGELQIFYDKGIYLTTDKPSKYTFWKCKNCNHVSQYNDKN